MAALLLARLLSDPGPEEQARICDWIAADPANAVALARAERAWEQAGQIAPSADVAASSRTSQPAHRRHAMRSFMLGGMSAASLLLASSAMPLTKDAPALPGRCPGDTTH